MTESTRPLAGRDREVELLEHLLEEGCARSPQILFVTGEPGIGKTSLLAELRRKAEERGCLALNGSAAEFERDLPFGLVVDALDEYLASLDPHAFHRLATEDLGELAGVFPALRSLDPGSDEPRTAAERYRAHRAVRDLIERLAAKQPLVLLLDDLHWADGASLELTSHLLRHPPRARVVLAIAFRTGQADRAIEAAIESAMRGSESVHRVALTPLAPADAATLVDLADPAERERLYRTSGGNPFYMLELARMRADGHQSSRAPERDGDVPSAVVAAIGGELDVLSAPARRLAEAGAVAGDPFELDLTMATARVAEHDALAAIDELAARDLVRPAAVPRRFHFRHPLVRHAVYESCTPGTRLAAHEYCANALAARGAPAAMRAHHVEQAARHGDLGAVAVLREAGEAAAQRAPASAARWFELALGLLPEAAPHGDRVALLMALAETLAATGHLEDSRAALVDSLALTADDEQDLRLNLIGMCASLEQLLGHHEEAHSRLETALASLSDRASPQAVALMIQLAVGSLYRADFDQTRDWGERALGVAQALGDLPLVAASTAVLAVAGTHTAQVHDAQAHSSQAAALVDALRDEELERRLDALTNLCMAELFLHRFHQAAAHAKRALAIGRATGRDIAPTLGPVLASVLNLWGRMAESAELLDEAIEGARLSGHVEALGWNLQARAFTAVAAGDVDLALTTGQEAVELTRDLDDALVSMYAGVALAHAHYESGEARRAAEVLMMSAGGEDLPLIPDGWRANYFELLTRCWLAVGRPDQAEQAATRAASTAGLVRLPLANAMSHRAAAAVALERGDAIVAAERAFAAIGAAEEIGARVDAAMARTLAGRALADAGDSARAVNELERAAEQLDACGALRYRNQAEHELRKLGRHPYRRTQPKVVDGAGVETLTQREVEIARLVAKRRTNPEIASELVLSIKTIETHMRNIFRKLDVSSRFDVTLAMERAEEDRQAPTKSRARPAAPARRPFKSPS